jgi:zinc protease
VVPTSAIDRALWMESDRMGYLLPALTPQRFETQRDVVLNERRQNYENRPYGMSAMVLSSALYAPDHPYSWTTIGSADDIRAMQLDDVQAFFRTYYHPANASLVLAGDITTDRGFELAEKYFSELQPGTRPARMSVGAALSRDINLVLEDRVELPRLYLAWHSPAMFASGDADLDLAADLLANGKTSRLYRNLVYGSRIALDVSAFQNSRELGSFFLLAVTAAPGHGLTDIAARVDDELQRLAASGPAADEMERGLAQAEAHFMYRLQTIGGFGGKSDQLNAYNVLLGTPGFFAEDLDRYRQSTPESVRSAAARFLVGASRVVVSVVPRGRRDLAIAGAEPVSVS